MEQYREILIMAARQELGVAIVWSVVLIAVIGGIWICRHLNTRKLRIEGCRSEKKKQKTGKMLRQSTLAAVALTGICLVLGAILWVSTLQVRRDIRKDLDQNGFLTYTGVYSIEDRSSLSKYRLFDRWTTVDLADGEIAYLYINSPIKWLQTEYGAFEGTVVYGQNSRLLVDVQCREQ